eukprot:gnl/TRDRNA2_/TRDRNA2_190590_c0_seq1.p1 gnl/TRDRNA2_/TRDRNA2_190590_c0~~gnl/TRDRNA2_/TRDRNA2_190590_c0_seq1.p1  ORF type:complete len:610 (+),score=69.41 gnl/TRDRNA2_/TRDRNA2_190590_c0_seq1:135-1964(+)
MLGRTAPRTLQLSLTQNPEKLPGELADAFEPIGEEMLGSGAYAVVKLLRRRTTGELFALKCVEKYPLQIRNMVFQMHREVRIQKSLNHPNILALVSHFEDESYVYMLLEYCAKGSLCQLIQQSVNKHFSEPEAAGFFEQIVSGVSWMHQHSCVHRDLKLENILLTQDGVVKICDFGWSADVEIKKMLKTTCGTTAYWAPEIFLGESQDKGVDMWALGCLLYEMVSGHPPFWQVQDPVVLKRKVLDVEFACPPWFSKDVCNLVSALLKRNPVHRISCQAALDHAWLRGYRKQRGTSQQGDAASAQADVGGGAASSELTSAAPAAAEGPGPTAVAGTVRGTAEGTLRRSKDPQASEPVAKALPRTRSEAGPKAFSPLRQLKHAPFKRHTRSTPFLLPSDKKVVTASQQSDTAKKPHAGREAASDSRQARSSSSNAVASGARSGSQEPRSSSQSPRREPSSACLHTRPVEAVPTVSGTPVPKWMPPNPYGSSFSLPAACSAYPIATSRVRTGSPGSLYVAQGASPLKHTTLSPSALGSTSDLLSARSVGSCSVPIAVAHSKGLEGASIPFASVVAGASANIYRSSSPLTPLLWSAMGHQQMRPHASGALTVR